MYYVAKFVFAILSRFSKKYMPAYDKHLVQYNNHKQHLLSIRHIFIVTTQFNRSSEGFFLFFISVFCFQWRKEFSRKEEVLLKCKRKLKMTWHVCDEKHCAGVIWWKEILRESIYLPPSYKHFPILIPHNVWILEVSPATIFCKFSWLLSVCYFYKYYKRVYL